MCKNCKCKQNKSNIDGLKLAIINLNINDNIDASSMYECSISEFIEHAQDLCASYVLDFTKFIKLLNEDKIHITNSIIRAFMYVEDGEIIEVDR